MRGGEQIASLTATDSDTFIHGRKEAAGFFFLGEWGWENKTNAVAIKKIMRCFFFRGVGGGQKCKNVKM